MRILNTYYEDVPPSNVLTPEEIVQICCEPVTVDECSEVGKVTPYEGADQSDIDKDAALEQARADNPGKRILRVQIEDVGRPGKPCGEQHETWQGSLNCCDEVEPIYFDDSMTADVLPAGGSIYLFAVGGIAPFTFRTTSNATSFPDGHKTWKTMYPVARLDAGPTFCGLTAISVTDGCSSDSQEIRSDLGEWYSLGNTCVLSGAPADYTGNLGTTWWYATAISGRFKTTESQSILDYASPTFGYMTVHCRGYIAGGCGSSFYCLPCPAGFESTLADVFNSCFPGIRSEDNRPCLAAGITPERMPSMTVVLAHSGNTYDWVTPAGYNSMHECQIGGVADFYRKSYVLQGPIGPESWEWRC